MPDNKIKMQMIVFLMRLTSGLIVFVIALKKKIRSGICLFSFCFLLFALTSLQSRGQTRQDSIRSGFQFADSLLTQGNHAYHLMDFVYPQEILDISIKMQNAMVNNKQWFADYMQKYYGEDKGLPYDPHFGISQGEYDKMKLIDSIQPAKKIIKTGQIVINKTNGIISLRSAGDYHVLDYIKIDLLKQEMVFEKDTLAFDQSMNVPNNKMLGPWRGYSRNIFNTNRLDRFTINQLSGKQINLIFGIINTGQKFIRVKYADIRDGRPIANGDLCFFLN